MLTLTKEQLKSHQYAKSLLKIKVIEMSEIIVIIQVNIEAKHIVFVI